MVREYQSVQLILYEGKMKKSLHPAQLYEIAGYCPAARLQGVELLNSQDSRDVPYIVFFCVPKRASGLSRYGAVK